MDNVISYLEKVISELELLDTSWPIEAETYVEFESLRKKAAMCARRVYGQDSTQESRLWNISSGEKHLRITAEKRAERLVAAIQELASETKVIVDEKRLFGVMHSSSESAIRKSVVESNSAVFIVHGSDDKAKVEVARFLEKVKLKAVILHEQPSKGRTILEKFEHHANDASYAVVLLTADDDVSGGRNGQLSRKQARQNVVFELGFFCGGSGRSRVAVLYEDGVALPSDISGLVYIPLDSQGAWQLALAKELKAAGLSVNFSMMLN